MYCQVQPEQLDRVLLHPEMDSCHTMFQYYQRLYKLPDTSARPARYQSGPGSIGQVLGDNGDMSEKVNTESVKAAIAEKENMTMI